jgi:hypothetical protein
MRVLAKPNLAMGSQIPTAVTADKWRKEATAHRTRTAAAL